MTTAIFTSPRYLLSKYGFRYRYFFWAYFRARASTQVEELSMFFGLWAALPVLVVYGAAGTSACVQSAKLQRVDGVQLSALEGCVLASP